MKTARLKTPMEGWPETIPWPEAGEEEGKGDFCKGALSNSKGQCCLSGWHDRAWESDMGEIPSGLYASFSEAWTRLIMRVTEPGRPPRHLDVVRYNDDPDTTDKDRQQVWEDVFSPLYEVVE